MGELYKSRALVLFRRPWKDNDEIVGLLTPQYGRLDAAVRGSKPLKSGWTGKLEPFVELQCLLARGHNFSYLTQADIVRSYAGIRSSYERLCWGGYLLELWAAVTVAESGQAAEYELLRQALQSLEEADHFRLGCCWAEWRLLESQGLGLQTRCCVRCGRGGGLTAVSYSEGGLVCRDCWNADPSGGGEPLPPRLTVMLKRLPRLTAETAVKAAADAEEMKRLERIVWRHWCACGLPAVRARRLIEGLP